MSAFVGLFITNLIKCERCRYLPKASDGYRRLLKADEGYRRLPKVKARQSHLIVLGGPGPARLMGPHGEGLAP